IDDCQHKTMQWLPLQKYPKDAAKSLIYNTSVASGRKKWRFGVELGWPRCTVPAMPSPKRG
ncbi:MAG: hypothetical protein Q8S02_09480, partial [Hydrogenophaga sp.]|nr:hypothetical protein [Hydrogenophaga sp.]